MQPECGLLTRVPFFSQDIHTAIAHAPIELAVIALDNAVEVMIAVANVGGEAMGNALPASPTPRRHLYRSTSRDRE